MIKLSIIISLYSNEQIICNYTLDRSSKIFDYVLLHEKKRFKLFLLKFI